MIDYSKKLWTAVMAIDDNWGVGYNNKLPWGHIKEDLAHFRDVTMDGIILMGHNTWKGIGSKKLPGRINIVISNSIVEGADYTLSGDMHGMRDIIEDIYPTHHVFLIGGAGLVKEAVENNLINGIILSNISGNYTSDTFFDKNILENFKLIDVETLKPNSPQIEVEYYLAKEPFYGTI